MRNEIYWLDEHWPGQIALAPRPRGGDWLEEELNGWKKVGVAAVLSLLTPEEERDLDLENEGQQARTLGLEFLSFPIPDRQVPTSAAKLESVLERVKGILVAGKNVLIHCRQGIGRTGLVAACLLLGDGMSPGAAIEKISAVRGVPVPETTEQREWIGHYTTAFTE